MQQDLVVLVGPGDATFADVNALPGGQDDVDDADLLDLIEHDPYGEVTALDGESYYSCYYYYSSDCRKTVSRHHTGPLKRRDTCECAVA